MNPEFNWPIVGHKNAVEYLQQSIVRGVLAQAYLFCGPVGVGKNFTAKIFSQSLLCENNRRLRAGEGQFKIPCGVCSSCRQFSRGIYADFYVIERETNEKTGRKKGIIGVPQIREVIEKISKRAFLNSYKIVLIPEAEALNQEASNCLLKTLEEPTPRTMIILISSRRESLLPTILSRIQAIKFTTVPTVEIYEALVAAGANRSVARELSRIALGRPAVALRFLSDNQAYEEYKKENLMLLNLMRQNAVEKFQLIDEITAGEKASGAIMKKLDLLSGIARDSFLLRLGCPELVSAASSEGEIAKLNSNSAYSSVDFLSQIEAAKELIKSNITPRLVLENLFL